jgi:hypothetical protein
MRLRFGILTGVIAGRKRCARLRTCTLEGLMGTMQWSDF